MIATALIALTLGQANQPLLTLDDALLLAETSNLDLKAAQARLGQAQLTARKVWANYLPQLSIGGGYTRNSAQAKIPFTTGYWVRDVGQPQGPAFDPARDVGLDNPPGQQTPFVLVPSAQVEFTLQPLNQWAGQAKLTQALIAPALWPAIRAAYLAQDVAKLSVESVRREILFGAAQLYYGAAGLKEALKVQQRLLEANVAHERDAKVRYEAGALPKVAYLRAEIDRVKAEQDLKRSQNGLASAKSALATLLDRDDDFDVAVPSEPSLPAELSILSQRALTDRPDVLAALTATYLAKVQRVGTELKYLPSIGLTATYQIANLTGFTGRNDSWAVGVGASWTIWDGGGREAELAESELKVLEAETSRRAAEQRAEDEVRRAILELDSARANRVKATEQVDLARENMSLVKVSYDSGAATYLEVTDANAALLGAEINAVAEGLNASLAALKLLKAAGAFAAR